MGSDRRYVGAYTVREYLKRNPDIATRTAAKALHSQYPDLFTSVETARCCIRRVRGAIGVAERRKICNRMDRTSEDAERCKRWGALIPDPDPTDWGWRELPGEVQRWLILADLHLPYHDKASLQAAVMHAEGNCDGVLLLGDVADFYGISSFQRDPRRRDLKGEIAMVLRFWDTLLALKPKAIVYKGGNHEQRYERYCIQRAPELWPVIAKKLTLPVLLDLPQRGITWVRPQDPIRHHQLVILHGHEWGNRFSSPVNPARGAFLKAHECVIQGHEHRSSNHAETTVLGTTIRTWSVGCCCDLHPEYRPLGNKWDSGFAYLNSGSDWSIEQHGIIEGKVM